MMEASDEARMMAPIPPPPSKDASWKERALAHQAEGRHEEAAEAYETHVAQHPDDAAAWAHLGSELTLLGRLAQGEAASRKAIELRPTAPSGWTSLGLALGQQERFAEAETAFLQALALDPQDPHSRMALAECLFMRRAPEEGVAQLELVLAQDPGNAHALKRLVDAYTALGDKKGLHRTLERWADADPGNPNLHWSRGIARMMEGRWLEGWADMEERFRIQDQVVSLMPPFEQPRWRGEPFPGKTLLLHWEQGFGDTFMMIRFAAAAKARGGRVIAVVQPNLADVIATCEGLDAVIPHGAPLPPFDVHLPLMSLPEVFQVVEESLPRQVPYLRVPEHVPCREALSQVLSLPTGRIRAGLAWAGNPKHLLDGLRSIPAEELTALADLPGVAWHVLQMPPPKASPIPAVPLSTFFRSFSDTAFAIQAMDVVVTIDSAIAHLAGALGKPTFLLLQHGSEWRWQLEREDSPWYPTFRLYRQPRSGDWASVLEAVKADLAAWVARGTPPDPPNPPALPLDALLARAAAQDRDGHLEDAESLYLAYLERDPAAADVWAELAGLRVQKGDPVGAEAAAREALARSPRHALARVNLAHALLPQHRLDEAESCCRSVLAREPEHAEALLAFADLHLRRKAYGEAEALLRRLLERDPGSEPLHQRLDDLHARLRNRPAIRTAVETDLALLPEPEAAYARGLWQLRFGEVEPGWAGFERRFESRRVPFADPGLAGPRWTGGGFEGRTLLLHWEADLSDTLLGLRYLPRVKALGGRVLLCVPRELMELAATCPGADLILPAGEPLPPHDLHAFLMSLPGIFREDLARATQETPYLRVPACAHARTALDTALARRAGHLRFGVSWGVRPVLRRGLDRSIPKEAWQPLASLPQVSWFSLQAASAGGPALPALQDLSPWLGTYAETAHALSQLDLLITADTAVAHLAGALGVPTFLMLPFLAHWRWLLDRDDTPWYPTFRLYRQPEPGDWASVFRAVAADLAGSA